MARCRFSTQLRSPIYNFRRIIKFSKGGRLTTKGDTYDRESLVKRIKQVDVVMLAVGGSQLAEQIKIIDALKMLEMLRKEMQEAADESLKAYQS